MSGGLSEDQMRMRGHRVELRGGWVVNQGDTYLRLNTASRLCAAIADNGFESDNIVFVIQTHASYLPYLLLLAIES